MCTCAFCHISVTGGCSLNLKKSAIKYSIEDTHTLAASTFKELKMRSLQAGYSWYTQ